MGTKYFDLEKFGAEGRISDKGYKFSLRDRQTIDSLLWTLINHDHRDVSTEGVLIGPSILPDLTVANTGGTMSGGIQYHYKVSFVDQYDNETEASTAATTVTDSPLASPTVPILATASTGGSLNPGVYRYALSYYQGTGGETRAANIASILVPTGTSTNTVTITLPDMPTGGTGWNVYRQDPTNSSYFYLDNQAAPATDYVDDGAIEPNCLLSRPTANSTNSLNKITIDINSADLPLDARIISWKIYRSTTVGLFGPSSLLATVVETTTEGGNDLVTTYVDSGGSTYAGTPLASSVMPPPVPQLDASAIFSEDSGRLSAVNAPKGVHSQNTFLSGTLVDATTYNEFYLPYDMPIERIDAYFLTAPTGLSSGTAYLTMRVSDDATMNEQQSVYTSSATDNEVQYVYNNATSGTFTLSDGTSTTSDLDFDFTAAEIEAELEADIAAITDVAVGGAGTSANPWVITWVDPGEQDISYTLIADDTNLVGGSSTVTVATNGSDGGTFTLSDGADTTNAINWDDVAATIKTRLETDITAYTEVTVTGTGTSSDPWIVEFNNPGSQAVDMMIADSSSLNGTAYVERDIEGYSSTQVDLIIDQNQAYHFWQSSLTDFGEAEAEDEIGGNGGTVSDAFATNDVATQIEDQDDYAAWDIGTGIDAGDYTAKFFVYVESGATYDAEVIDNDGGATTVASTTVSDGTTYIPAHELLFTDTGSTEDWEFRVTKTDAGAGVVRVDKYEYEVRHPTLHAGATASVEIIQTGSPTTNGDDVNTTIWY